MTTGTVDSCWWDTIPSGTFAHAVIHADASTSQPTPDPLLWHWADDAKWFMQELFFFEPVDTFELDVAYSVQAQQQRDGLTVAELDTYLEAAIPAAPVDLPSPSWRQAEQRTATLTAPGAPQAHAHANLSGRVGQGI